VISARVTPRFTQGMPLGDSILLSGAAVHLAKKHGGLRVPTDIRFYKSVCEMYCLFPEIQVYTSIHHPPCARYPKLVDINDENSIVKELMVGPGLGPVQWYDQLGVPFQERWQSCPIQQITDSMPSTNAGEVFIHDDPIRGFVIPVDGYRPKQTLSIFDHVPAIKAAKEIHCIGSAFFHLIESMPDTGAELFLYLKGKPMYQNLPFRHSWTIANH
jgi:hypothetical protein